MLVTGVVNMAWNGNMCHPVSNNSCYKPLRIDYLKNVVCLVDTCVVLCNSL